MARSRVCRHDVRCPHCGSNRMRKDGFADGRQAYRCGDCGRRQAPGGAYRRPGEAVKERALRTYAEGSSLRAIGQVLGYSAPAVLGQVKRGAADPSLLRGGAGGGGVLG